MNNLINKLTDATQDLKASYLKNTAAWAKEQIQRNIDRANSYKQDWQEAAKVKANSDLYYKEQRWYYTAPLWSFTDELIERSVAKAENHYAASIEKLAHRIIKKGLDVNKIAIENTSLDPNLSCCISDGSRSVTAYTIIASGAVQRPHYRYLLK